MELMAGRVEGIISGLLADDHQTFVCHKTLRSERMTCAGAVGVMSKLGRLPLIARLGLVMGLITKKDIEASAAISSAGRQQRMQAAFEAKYQRDWNDPAGDEMKAVWSDAWAAANAGMPS